jgi:hypothetical protein
MIRSIAFVLLLSVSALAQAQAPADSLSRCLADNTTGKDRKDLARWVFLAMAAHPEIKQYASDAAASGTEETHKAMAGIFTRLLTESCPQQTLAAFKLGGATAIQVGFHTLGQLAMQELMSDSAVSATMGGFQKHLNQEKLNQLFSTK